MSQSSSRLPRSGSPTPSPPAVAIPEVVAPSETRQPEEQPSSTQTPPLNKRCSACGEIVNLTESCLNPEALPGILGRADWRCGRCQVCWVCQKPPEDAESEMRDFLLPCGRCDRTFHLYCLRPPLEAMPTGKWLCPICLSGVPKRVLVLVGPQSSGKSFVAKQLSCSFGWVSLTQDTLGSRDALLEAARAALKDGNTVVIDRTNFTPALRHPFVDLARRAGIPVDVLWVDTPLSQCLAQLQLRGSDHPNFPDCDWSRAVLTKVHGQVIENQPTLEEGFRNIYKWSEVQASGLSLDVALDLYPAPAPAAVHVTAPVVVPASATASSITSASGSATPSVNVPGNAHRSPPRFQRTAASHGRSSRSIPWETFRQGTGT